MKKNLVLRTILVSTIMAFLLIGCGKAEAEPDEVPEVTQQEVKEPAAEKEEEAELQEEEQKEEEPEVQEEVAEKEEETSNEMPEAQVTTTVLEVGSLLDYMESLDSKQPAIVIYNPSAGTIINIQEGQHYNLKKDDQIIVNRNWDSIESWAFNTEVVSNEYTELSDFAVMLYSDYTKFSENQEFYYEIWLTDDPDEVSSRLTCYLTAPAE